MAILALVQEESAASQWALSPLLLPCARGFASLKRQWAYRLAEQAVTSFRVVFDPYRQAPTRPWVPIWACRRENGGGETGAGHTYDTPLPLPAAMLHRRHVHGR